MSTLPDDNAFNRWLGYTPRLGAINDIELLTLKIHVVVEDALQHLLAMRLGVDEETIAKLRLRFETLASLALADPASDSLLEALLSLNAARNKAAHSIDHPVFRQHIEKFHGIASTLSTASGKSVVFGVDSMGSAGDDAIAAIYERAVPFWKT